MYETAELYEKIYIVNTNRFVVIVSDDARVHPVANINDVQKFFFCFLSHKKAHTLFCQDSAQLLGEYNLGCGPKKLKIFDHQSLFSNAEMRQQFFRNKRNILYVFSRVYLRFRCFFLFLFAIWLYAQQHNLCVYTTEHLHEMNMCGG